MKPPQWKLSLVTGQTLMFSISQMASLVYFSCVTFAVFQLNRKDFINNFQSKKNSRNFGL